MTDAHTTLPSGAIRSADANHVRFDLITPKRPPRNLEANT
jgi:hypothetical protein